MIKFTGLLSKNHNDGGHTGNYRGDGVGYGDWHGDGIGSGSSNSSWNVCESERCRNGCDSYGDVFYKFEDFRGECCESIIFGVDEVKLCSFEGCGMVAKKKGLCCGHYDQRRKGKPLRPLFEHVRPKGDLPRILFDEQPCSHPTLKGPCHIIRGAPCGRGYGRVTHKGKLVGAHKYVWELAHGKVEKGFEVDHICRVRRCVNLDHLRAVPKRVNLTENCEGMMWQLQAAKTHCPQGHPYSGDNLWTGKEDGRAHRKCKICMKLASELKQARKRGMLF